MGARDAIDDALEAAGVPAAEDHFRSDALGALGTHAVVRYGGTETQFCNDSAHFDVDEWSVTLYSPERDEAAEKKVVTALRNVGLPVGKSSSGYDDEHRVHWCEWDFQAM